MENLINTVASITTNLITYFILIDFFKTKYTSKVSQRSLNVITFLMIMGSVLVNSYNMPNLNLLYIIIAFVILNMAVFIVDNYKNMLINISFFVIVILLLDACTYIIVNSLMSLEGNIVVIDIKAIVNSLLEFIIYNIFKNFLVKKNTKSLKNIETISYIVLSLISFTIIWFIIVFIEDANYNLRIFFFCLTICLIVLNIYMVRLIDTVSKTHELEEKISLIEKSSQMMFSHYHYLEESDKKTKFILHDIKNHLVTLENTANVENKKEYLNNIKSEIKKLYLNQYTERKILNVLLNEKVKEASRKNTIINIHNSDPDLSFISDFDIVTIFSNLLDNAMDGVNELPETERTVDLYINRIKDFIIIRTNNPCLNKPNKVKGKIVSSKKEHKGLGLMSIENTLKKYDGNMEIEVNEDMQFTNTILFCLTK